MTDLSGKREKARKAAIKAWRTIRRHRLESRGKLSYTLELVTPNWLNGIKHPEGLVKVSEPQAISYGKIIRPFNKTSSDIVCGRFWELRWAYGCPFDCSYCYLRGTTRGQMKPRYVRIRYVLRALDEVFNDSNFNNGKPVIFNSGELSDSLMNPQLMEQIADKFETQHKHKLLTLSKCGPQQAEFLVRKPRKQTICAWSINAIEAARRWEGRAASPDERIKAAKMVNDVGYETWTRIDPIFPISNWRFHYEDILYRIFSEFEPARIILGTPRGLSKTISFAQKAGVDMSWREYFAPEDTGWGMKLPFNQRLEIYNFFYERLGTMGYDLPNLSICKETLRMWEALNRPYQPHTCQCYGQM